MQFATMSSNTESDHPNIRCYETLAEMERVFFSPASQHIVCESCHQETQTSEINNTFKNLEELLAAESNIDGLNLHPDVVTEAGLRQQYQEYLDRKQNSIEEEKKMKELCLKTYRELQRAKRERIQLAKKVLFIKQQKRQDNDHNRHLQD